MSPKIFSVNVHRPKLNCHEWKLTLFKQAKLPTMETKTLFFLYVKGYLTPALIKTAHLVFFITIFLVQLCMILCPYLDGLTGPLKYHGHSGSETVWILATKLRAVKPLSYL